MSTIEQRGKTFRVKVRVKGQRVRTATFDTRKEALTWSKQIEAAIYRGDPRTTQAYATFGQWIERYIREVAPIWKTGREKSSRLRWVAQQDLSEKGVEFLTPSDFEALKAKLVERKLAPQTVRHYLMDCSAVWEEARRKWRVTSLPNPLRDTDIPAVSAGRKGRIRTNAWDLVMGRLRAHVNPFYPRLAEFLMETAMRVHEPLLLRKGDIDREGSLLTVIGKGDAQRFVPLTPRALELLDEALRLRGELPGRFSLPNGGFVDLEKFDEDVVWPVTYTGFYRAWVKAREEADVGPVWIHDIRRERATRLLEQGWAVPEVASVTGHTDMRTLNEHYLVIEAQRIARKLRQTGRG